MAAIINDETKGISRREFLTYLWGASAVLLVAEAGGAAIWFALPHTPYSQLGLYSIDPSLVPVPNANPIAHPDGKFWLSNTDKGLLAVSMICVHRMDAYYKWVSSTHRFECPVCGSKYSLDGHKLRVASSGPARRDLDRFVIRVSIPIGIFTTPADGSPVNIEGANSIMIDTNKKILGQPLR